MTFAVSSQHALHQIDLGYSDRHVLLHQRCPTKYKNKHGFAVLLRGRLSARGGKSARNLHCREATFPLVVTNV